MALLKTLTLFGAPGARKRARLTLEDQPQIKRLDAAEEDTRIRLLLSAPLTEGELLALLADSGISGLRIG